MFKGGGLNSNILANVSQTAFSAVLLFALYRYINTTLGVEQLGVWSVVLATASASRLADFGLSAGVIRFVARDRARNEFTRAGRVIDTTVLTLLAVVGVLLLLLYPLLAKLLSQLFQSAHLALALEILPYALISLWLTIIGAIFQGGLDGCQRMDIRAALIVISQAILLILAVFLVPNYGLLGLAFAQIGQGLFLTIVGRFLLCSILPCLPRLPCSWDKQVLKEMLGYGANIQAGAFFMMLFDPVAKVLMAGFGGPATAGYFEIASQIVQRIRAFIASANQAIVPHVAVLAEDAPAVLMHLYIENMRFIAFFSLPVFALLIAWGGPISWLLIGTYQPEFVSLLGILTLAWGINIFAVPAYFSNLGTGEVGWNTLSHLIIGVLNTALGFLLGELWGTHGVVLGYAIALIVGSVVLIGVFQHRSGLGWRCMFTSEDFFLIASCLAIGTYGWLEPLRPAAAGQAFVIAILPLMALGAVIWLHPLRKRLWCRP